MVLYASSRPKFLCFLTYVDSSKSIGRGKTFYYRMICYKGLMILRLTIHDQHRFDYFEFSDNEDDEMFNIYVTISVDTDVDEEILTFCS